MEYQVPQFIEVEDKIVGPLTLKQFIYLAGTAGICVVFFFTLPLVFAILLAIPIVALGVALSFYKVNGKTFVEMLEAGFNYYLGAKMFLWRRDVPKQEDTNAAAAAAAASVSAAAAAATTKAASRLTRGKLSELAWTLDVQKPPGADNATS